jgi:pilus assembly protein Flp/PilA
MRQAIITLHNQIWTLLTREEGQGLVEYALIFMLIVIVAIAALTLLGGKVTSELSTVSNSVSRAVP